MVKNSGLGVEVDSEGGRGGGGGRGWLRERHVGSGTVNRLVPKVRASSLLLYFSLPQSREYFLSATAGGAARLSVLSKFLLLSPMGVYYVCYAFLYYRTIAIK